MSRPGPLGLAVVGCGRAARSHLNAIVGPGLDGQVKLAALVTRDAGRLEAYGRDYRPDRAYRDLAGALSDPDVEAVILCLPHSLHAEAAIACASAGKHVLVEKPMAVTSEEARRMIEACDRARVTLMVGQSRRFTRAVQAAHRLATGGAIGELVSIHAVVMGFMEEAQTTWWRNASREGGLLLSLWGPHIVDFILWLVGRKPDRVYVEGICSRPELWDAEDEVAAVLGFGGGGAAAGGGDRGGGRTGAAHPCLASIHMSWNLRVTTGRGPGAGPAGGGAGAIWDSRGGRYERTVIGTLGSLVLSDDTELWLNGRPEVTRDTGEQDNFAQEIVEFASAIREGRQPAASGREVYRVVETLEACRESASRREVVRLS